ncbi:MAG: 50S ribosomal protein L10 [Planctomycetota bacterium]
MPNILNEMMLEEYRMLVAQAAECVFVDPEGLTVAEVREFRRQLRSRSLHMRVVKTSLASIAYRERGFRGLDGLFKGPTAILYGGILYGGGVEAALQAARVLGEWHKKSGKQRPSVKGGILEGEVLDPARAAAMANLPSRAEVQARIVSATAAPGRRLTSAVAAPGCRIAGALESLVERLEGNAKAGGAAASG